MTLLKCIITLKGKEFEESIWISDVLVAEGSSLKWKAWSWKIQIKLKTIRGEKVEQLFKDSNTFL